MVTGHWGGNRNNEGYLLVEYFYQNLMYAVKTKLTKFTILKIQGIWRVGQKSRNGCANELSKTRTVIVAQRSRYELRA